MTEYDPESSVLPFDNGRFRPESLGHFKEVAKSVAWLLERPLQQCQEKLARVYGYSGLHELQVVLKNPGAAGPFEPRYAYLDKPEGRLVEHNDRRIQFFLFGEPSDFHRDRIPFGDKAYLVFELGLFQEAAEYRACLAKIEDVVEYRSESGTWPLVSGWPLGLRAWFAKTGVESFEYPTNWQNRLGPLRFDSPIAADIRWQSRYAALVRLDPMFRILAARIAKKKPTPLSKVDFQAIMGTDEIGVERSSYEENELLLWLLKKQGIEFTYLYEALEEHPTVLNFVRRPTRSSSSATNFTKTLPNSSAFRDRWAFECIKAITNNPDFDRSAFFTSKSVPGFISSLLLRADLQDKEIGEDYGGSTWQAAITLAEVVSPATDSQPTILQPVVHASGSLVLPLDNKSLELMDDSAWFLIHEASDYASEAAAEAFISLYLPSVGIKSLEQWYRAPRHELLFGPICESVLEIDDLVIANGVSIESLAMFFQTFADAFDDGVLPDSHGGWSTTLELSFTDDDENQLRNENGEFADYVYAPTVFLINVPGCGMSYVRGTRRGGRGNSDIEAEMMKGQSTAEGVGKARMIIEATRSLDADVVIYDARL